MKNTQDIQELRKMVVEEMRPFSPIAYYDENMDLIRVKLRDCSVLESRVNGWLTILRDNHPKPDQSPCMGLTIKGVKHLFDTVGLPKYGVLTVVDVLNTILKELHQEDKLDDRTVKELKPCKQAINDIDLIFSMELEA